MSILKSKTGIVLMTYGSATTEDGVAEYFEHIHPGKISEALIEEFKRRYRLIGRSPLVEITRAQAALLERELGEGFIVRAGMRHSAPFIEEAVGELKDAGATALIGIILSPQFSASIMQGYTTAFASAAKTSGFAEKDMRIAAPWPAEPDFIELLATRVRTPLAGYGAMPVIFTTHSLPQRVAEQDPAYFGQLQATIDAVRAQLDPALEWYAAYQSAGHSPEAWLKPDLADVLKELATKGAPNVLIVPIQFLADHLEILYDLDIAAQEQCAAVGLAYHRIELPNTHPLFIHALARIAYISLDIHPFHTPSSI